MTEQELTKLKQQIKDELLAEMQKIPQKRNFTAWDQMRPMIDERTSHLNTHEQYQFISAISTIIRHTLGIRHVRFIPFSRQEEVTEFVTTLLDEIDRMRKTDGQTS